MSELINKSNCHAIQRRLLSSVSVLAFLASACATGDAEAADDDGDRPLIWIELGGQAETPAGQGDAFVPAFLAGNPNASILWTGTSPIQAQKPPLFNFGEEAEVIFQPESSHWVFSASVRYGRSVGSKEVDHQTNRLFYVNYTYGVPSPGENPRGIDKFSDTHVHHLESHSILDFSAGKDVGMGMFGKSSSSTLSLGVRFAQFASKTTFDVRARPEVEFKYGNLANFGRPGATFQFPYYHTYHATAQATRSFHGAGPSLSWNASTPFIGSVQEGEVTFDWGANAALLFGRQKAHVKHLESQRYVSWQFALNGGQNYHSPYPVIFGGHDKVRTVTVPNAGGFVGLSFCYSDAKLSVGYRADLFFGAMDGGIDTAKKENVGFYGPFATVSIGLGG
jgi:iron complex outermembrane receptor protein